MVIGLCSFLLLFALGITSENDPANLSSLPTRSKHKIFESRGVRSNYRIIVWLLTFFASQIAHY
jgi:hypothetical protein